MDTRIRDFCVKYDKKLKNDKDIKENQLDFLVIIETEFHLV